MLEEIELVNRAKSGDRKALAQLVKNHQQTIYNFSFKICRDREKAENIMQETFLSMIKHLNQFDGNSRLSTWLYRIVSNHCLMQARKQKDKHFISLNDETDDDNEFYTDKYIADWSKIPTNVVENEELRQIMDEAIKKLDPDYRIVFLLRDIEGLSTEETAQATDLSIPAVKSRLHRARAFLRREISKAFSK
jgi:RNA polymerase sigma-70 factor (ECF subfamily)